MHATKLGVSGVACRLRDGQVIDGPPGTWPSLFGGELLVQLANEN
jgi:hypothetical protein